ncbi:MAG: bifunctional demethylmenaquinone methyltransferase/2-methoxy-6-polyprenyl-1,4-benzoquinol methylase UbiE [Rickettsiaceae bacterium H1]|nr:bifunctional demethylmenaquinone methyltransferase/2-methoxy-6-polyprenyl-1,4-benzoquinol methylase UbiE [Rickettsiaceae bacterium H1]
MEKNNFVKGVFSSVADKYDLMNNLMSFGIHHLWKNKFIKEINLKKDFTLLDVAGGTGDITTRILQKFTDCQATICDNNFEMIKQGIEKTTNKGYVDIDWTCGDAENLPFNKNSFDYYTIAFGIRNVKNVDFALEEAYRVLKPGGRFLCLEFSHIEDNFLFAKLYDLYSENIIPLLGKAVTGNKEAYQYLVDSIKAFPTQEQFANLITKTGFSSVSFRNLTKGIVAIHTGWKN